MIKQLLSFTQLSRIIPVKSIGKGWLMLAVVLTFKKVRGYYAGDLSGITAKKYSFWFSSFYKPGKRLPVPVTGTVKLKLL